MKKSILILTVLLTFSSLFLNGQVNIKEGILDFRYSGLPQKPVELNGEWEFYWNQHLLPSDFEGKNKPKPDIFASVPEYWIEYKDQLREIENTGYCTYRLRILIPRSHQKSLSLNIPVFDSSYRLYINGKYVNSNGVPGSSAGTTKPGYEPFTYSFKPINDTIDIIINVSNFHHRRGGFWLPVQFGESRKLILLNKQHSTISDISLGLLLAFAVFYFLFFLFTMSERSMFYFSMAIFSISLRTLVTGSFGILNFTSIGWQWLIKLEYISSFSALIFTMWYFYYQYKDRIVPWISTAFTVIFSLAIMLVLFTPVSIFSYSILIFHPVIMLTLLYYLGRCTYAGLKEEKYRLFSILGFVALIMGAINDILHSAGNTFITNNYVLNYSLVIFILTEVFIMLYKWLLSSKEQKRLLNEVEFVNKNLENIVIERTAELTNQKGEIERQKTEAEKKNNELEKIISVKNRIFSIIAHDLKSPVVNLRLMIEQLRTRKMNDESTHEIIDSISRQSSFAINLIENLLTWGEGQHNRISYKPEKINLTDHILDIFNTLHSETENKMIKIGYSHRGNPIALCDKNLTSIIIRNIVSNAIKFTPKNGTVSVVVEKPGIDDGMIHIKVRDNGVGMPQDKISKIIRNEIIESTPGTNNEKGTGLGLQLCYDLVKINRGSMNIKSNVNQGTTVTILLPAPKL